MKSRIHYILYFHLPLHYDIHMSNSQKLIVEIFFGSKRKGRKNIQNIFLQAGKRRFLPHYLVQRRAEEHRVNRHVKLLIGGHLKSCRYSL